MHAAGFCDLAMHLDQDILTGCRKGDRRSQFRLYELCYPYLMGVALRYRKQQEEAASAVNMAFLKILNHLDRFRDNHSFKSWMRQIMVNTLIDEYRKTSRFSAESRVVDYEKEVALNGVHVEYNHAETNLNMEQLVSFIHELNPLTASVFNMYVLDGFPHKEIASLLAISEAASKWHLFTARKQLQERVENASGKISNQIVPKIKVNPV